MNDEELVEVIAKRLRQTLTGRPAEIPESYAADLVDVIRSAGFQVYRPEDCDQTTVASELKDGSGYCWFGYQPAGVYSLVPADSGGSG